MNSSNGIVFVGLYVSFSVTRDHRKSQLLSAVLELEEHWPFRRALVGQTLGKTRWQSFAEGRKRGFLEDIEAGRVDTATLVPVSGDREYVESLRTQVNVFWTSAVIKPIQRSKSPVERRFGDAGSLIVQYPASRFRPLEESSFQRRLIEAVKRSFVDLNLSWAFVHLGFQPVPVTNYGRDTLFLETRQTFPLTSFEPDLISFSPFYREFVKGAFWANFLNPYHLERLGGEDLISRERPCEVVEELGTGSLLQVDSSPLVPGEIRMVERQLENKGEPYPVRTSVPMVAVAPEVVDRYQRLRRFLKPILMESPEEVGRLQDGIMGSWHPSESQ